jgi:thiol-disulfide isomerase/thioredoxin
VYYSVDICPPESKSRTMKNIALLILSLFTLAFSVCNASGQGYQIRIKLNGYSEKNLYLAYHYGEKQYIKDTVQIDQAGYFVFKGEEKLQGGIYLIVMAPDNNFFQILVSDNDQNYSVTTSADDPSGNFHVEGSKDNELFYNYLNFLAKKRPLAESLRSEIEKAGEDQSAKEILQKKLNDIDAEVQAYQKKIVGENAESLTAAIIQANMPVDVPEFDGDDKEKEVKRWRFAQKHYFDNIDLTDPRMLRTPFLFQRIDFFVNKLQVQHPDTLSQAIDYVLEKVKPAEETFKFYLIHFLNAYAKSDIVGMDAVYVHLAEKYYETGQAPWTDPEQLEKIVDNAKTLKPLLIGKIAPDIAMQKRDGSRIALHDVDAEYTILYFWRYDCGACKKSTPDLKQFYEKFKDRGVVLFAVCAKYTDEVPECWKYVDENEIGDWLHTVDPYGRSQYSKLYNVKSTPQLYILDRKKEILSKRIGAEQLEEVMDKIIEMKKKANSSP